MLDRLVVARLNVPGVKAWSWRAMSPELMELQINGHIYDATIITFANTTCLPHAQTDNDRRYGLYI